MTRPILKYISIILTIFIISRLINTVYIRGVGALLIMGAVLLAVNLVLRPILLLISLPLNILTLGLFSFVVSAVTILIADSLVPGVFMGGFLNALLAAVIIAAFNALLSGTKKSADD